MSVALECAPCPLCGVLPNATSGPLDHFRFPAYLRQPGFLTPDECNWLIESVEKRHNYYPGYVHSFGGSNSNRMVGWHSRWQSWLARQSEAREPCRCREALQGLRLGTPTVRSKKRNLEIINIVLRAFDYVRRKNRELWRYPLPSSVDSALVEVCTCPHASASVYLSI